jgi:integrase
MAKDNNHHLMRRGNVWYFIKKVNGRRIIKSLSASLMEARDQRDEYLKEILLYGDINEEPKHHKGILFGEFAQEWIKIIAAEIKSSTLQDYRSSMNTYILPKFGNAPLGEIGYLDVKKFASELPCSGKRKNNVLAPLRSIFKMALLSGLIEKNPMDMVRNFKVHRADINPLSMEEVKLVLQHVSPRFKDFLVVAFFTGMRFGEMAALKWKNVDFKAGLIKVRETRVRGVEGRPKTKRSVRDIRMLPPVAEALEDQSKHTKGESDYVFLNQYGRPLLPDTMNQHVWKPALKKAGLKYRSLLQTRHTFATLMLDAGELPGWVQQMMGHETLQMIYEKYYSFIKNYQRDDGRAFMEKVYGPSMTSGAS